MNKVKFSILIPTYKDQYLKDCIESILNQSYQDFEIIIVNDASPFDIARVVNGFSDDRIKYYVNETGCGGHNVVDNWNICLSHASGQYVICMGDDDRLLPMCLASYCDMINKYPGLGVYHIQGQLIDESNNIIALQEGRPEWESVYSFVFHVMKSARMQHIGDFLFDTEMLRKKGGFYRLPYAWHSDRISVMIACMQTGIANCAEFGYQARVSKSQISAAGNSAIEKLGAWNEVDCWYKKFYENPPKDEVELEYFRISKQLYPEFIKRQVSREISDVLKGNPLKYFDLIRDPKLMISKKKLTKIFFKVMLRMV